MRVTHYSYICFVIKRQNLLHVTSDSQIILTSVLWAFPFSYRGIFRFAEHAYKSHILQLHVAVVPLCLIFVTERTKATAAAAAARCFEIPGVIYHLGISSPPLFQVRVITPAHVFFVCVFFYHHLSPGCADQMTWRWGSSGGRQRVYLEDINKLLCACPSLRWPVRLACRSAVPGMSFVTRVCVFLTAHSPVSPYPRRLSNPLDSICLPALISSSVSVQPDPPVVPAPFFRAWLVGWPTFGLIRVTYRRALRTCTHEQEYTGSLFSLHTGPAVLAWTIKPSAHQHRRHCECLKTHGLIWPTTAHARRFQRLQARLSFSVLFLGVYIKEEFGNMTTYQHA